MAKLKLFISYRREDCGGHAPALAGRIYDRLAKHFGEENVFMDVNTIPPGVDFTEYLGRAVEKADVFLALVGPDWVRVLRERAELANDFVRVELASALERSIPVVPLLVGGASMPAEADIPNRLRAFVYRNAFPVDSGRDFDGHLSHLISELEKHFQPKDAVGAEQSSPGKGGGNPFLSWVTAFGLVALLAGAFIYYFLLRADESQESPFEGVSREQPFVNSLGMEFVPVNGMNLLFSRWETRVGDFEAFIEETGHDAETAMLSLGASGQGWVPGGRTWRDPGFPGGQTPNHPAVGLNWHDAVAFCEWLSEKEGRTYRLPTAEEWEAALGGQKYPWGNGFPPPAHTVNLAGTEAKIDGWPEQFDTIEGYVDGHPRTAPVGSYPANRFGLHDLAGNAYEWCQDWYRKEMNPDSLRQQHPYLNEDGGGEAFRVMKGGSWAYGFGGDVFSASSPNHPDDRYSYYGFRCVVEE